MHYAAQPIRGVYCHNYRLQVDSVCTCTRTARLLLLLLLLLLTGRLGDAGVIQPRRRCCMWIALEVVGRTPARHTRPLGRRCRRLSVVSGQRAVKLVSLGPPAQRRHVRTAAVIGHCAKWVRGRRRRRRNWVRVRSAVMMSSGAEVERTRRSAVDVDCYSQRRRRQTDTHTDTHTYTPVSSNCYTHTSFSYHLCPGSKPKLGSQQ